MANNDNQDLIKYAKDINAIAKINKLVIFVGSGVSKNIPDMPSWAALIKEMANSIGYSRCNNCKEKDDCVDKETNNCKIAYDYSADELLKIPQYVFNSDPILYNSIIEKQISDKVIPEFSISKKIFEINPSHIITTNYDRIIESSSSVHRDQYDVIISDKELLDSEKSKYIIKMHGDILHPETIVLKEQDYLNYSQNHVVIELFIKALLTDHIFLFLGYSLIDYNVKQIISWINYLRSDNDVFKNSGYIVLDSEEIDNNIVDYFRKNNIEVLNIHNLPLINKIPDDLTDEKGKKLFSYLSLIRDQSLIKEIMPSESFGESVDNVILNKINDYAILLSILNIKDYTKKDNNLVLYGKNSKETYDQIISFFKKEDEKANLFKQSLINVGIRTIECDDENKKYSFSIESEIKSELVQDRFYSLYIENNYSEIVSLGKNEENVLKRSFYRFLALEDLYIYDEYNLVKFEELSNAEKIAYLHNKAILEALRTNKFDPTKVKNYINNIASRDEKQFYQFYLDMYEGNSAKKLKMLTSLNKLKENTDSNSTFFFEGYSYGELYNIKNIALTYYELNFKNFLLLPRNLSDTKNFFRPYIEAILCASDDKVVKKVNFSGLQIEYDKYPIDERDIDFLTKYISVNDLYKLLLSYKITYFRMEKKTTEHIISCFVNLIRSIIEIGIDSKIDIQISILANISLLLSRTTLEDKGKNVIATAIRELFLNERFHNRFWNILYPEIYIWIKALTQLLEKINFSLECNCIKLFANSLGFQDVLCNRVSEVKELIKYFINNSNIKEDELYVLIEKDENRKALMLELFHDWIKDKEKREEYGKYLSDRFSMLSSNARCIFVINGWVSIDEKRKQELLNDVIELYHKKNPLMRTYPDQLERKLEEIYIFYIFEIIEDISSLNELSKDYIYLDFILHPNEFDYTKVDFSNYMWQNFAKNKKLMKHFMDNKEKIIPIIEDKIRKDSVTEFERKLLYGFFMKQEQLL